MISYLLSLNPEANIADQWDFGFLKSFLDKNNFDIENVTKLPETDRAIVVIPARHHVGMEHTINDELDKIKHVVLFLMGDEEASFNIDKINHKSIHIWVQNPHMGKHDNYNKLGTGYPTHMTEYLPKKLSSKPIDVFFAGQDTHKRRHQLVKAMLRMQIERESIMDIVLLPTAGFTQGETKEEYYADMCDAKITPCPSGAVIPDSFRLFESLECMAIPIADQKTPDGEILEYWDWMFGEISPLPRTTNWVPLPEFVDKILEEYPANLHQITAWWIMYKRKFKFKVLDQLNG